MPDYTSAKRLKEERAVYGAEIRKMADALSADNEARKAKGEKARDFTPEEQAKWEEINKEYNAFAHRIEVAERADSVGLEMNSGSGDRRVGRTEWRKSDPRGAPTAEDHSLAVAAWARAQADCTPSEEELAAADRCGLRLDSKFCEIKRPVGMKTAQFWEGRNAVKYGATMSGQQGDIGGYLKEPGSLVRNLEMAMLEFGGVRRVAQTIVTSSGEPLTWPTGNDTSNTGRRIGESTTQTTTTTANPAFAQHVLNAYQYTSDFILVPFMLLQDSAFDIPSLIGRMLGERVGRKTNTDFTLSAGDASPLGIVTGATLGVTAASASAIACDELFDLIHEIDPAYRGMATGWMFHDSTLLAIRKLKDGQGRYMWEESIQVGEPDRILGWPYTINQDMAEIGTSAKVILFGRLSDYKVRDVAGVRLKRVDELFAVNDQVGFAYLSRHDGRLIDAGTHPVKYLQMHS